MARDAGVDVVAQPQNEADVLAGTDGGSGDFHHRLVNNTAVRHAHGLPEVLGSDVDHVQVGRGQNRVQVLDTFALLDHGNDEQFAISRLGPLTIVYVDGIVGRTPERVERPLALWIETRRIDQSLRIRSRVTARYMDALRSGVQEPQGLVSSLRESDDRRNV